MKRFRGHVKFKDGTVIRMTVLAKDRDDAREQIDAAQKARAGRADRTFANLAAIKETGQPGMYGIDPKYGGAALTEAFVKRETEKRKRDLGRYDTDYRIEKIEEVK
jgi:hypothetical protein